VLRMRDAQKSFEKTGGPFLGRLMRYAVRSGDLEWLVDQPDPGAGAPLEGPVLVRVNATRVHIIPDAG